VLINDLGTIAGAVHQRQEGDVMGEPALKRSRLDVPSLSDCLGSEGLRMIRNLETEGLSPVSNNNFEDVQSQNSVDVFAAEAIVNVNDENEKKGRKIGIGYEDELIHAGPGERKDIKQGKSGGKLEATGPGAAGILSGATVSTRQEP
jgi:hypothetical protein